MDIAKLEELFKRTWCEETSAYPESWSANNPACGQCLSTSMVAQDFLGGEIVFAWTNFGCHFWNLLPCNEEKDFTSSQLPESFIYPKSRREPREFLDAFGKMFPEILRRYNLLKSRVIDII